MNLAALNAGDVRAFSSFFMSEVYMNCTNSKDDLPLTKAYADELGCSLPLGISTERQYIEIGEYYEQSRQS